MNRPQDSVTIRRCEGVDELGACVRLQAEIWGSDERELVAIPVMLVAAKIGGQVIGAFAQSSPEAHEGSGAAVLAGFAFAMPGIRSSGGYLHSHMLAVRDRYRNHGLGQRLKRFQREDALRRGITLMEWTFDPLEAKNAFLNLTKLGAIARRYVPDFYGASLSPLQGGIPTDRLCAEWWMSSERVKASLRSGPVPLPRVEHSILLPREAAEWKRLAAGNGGGAEEFRQKLLQVQERHRRSFSEAFSQGLAVVGFERDAAGNGRFQLGRVEATDQETPLIESDPDRES